MSTASPQSVPTLQPGRFTSEFSLATLAAFGGLALVMLSICLAAFHPVAPQLQELMMKGGLFLLGTSPAVYGGFRTALKYAHAARGFEAQANMLAAAIPGQAGVDAKLVLSKLEQILDVLPDPGDAQAPPPTPVEAAAAAGADAATQPAAGL